MSIDIHRVQLGLSALIAITVLSACGGSNESVPPVTSSTETSTTPIANSSASRTSTAAVTALSITGQPATSISLGAAYYFNANTTGGNGNAVTFGIQNRPSWVTLNTNTGELKGTPDKTGTFSNIIISATDGQSTVQLPAFTIAVGGTGTPASTVAVTVSWVAPSSNTDGSTFNNPAGFVIHYGTSASNLSKSVSIGSYTARSYNLTGLSKGSTYYFSVAAINTLNMEGERSPITSIAL